MGIGECENYREKSETRKRKTFSGGRKRGGLGGKRRVNFFVQ